MTIILNGRRFEPVAFEHEQDFEDDVAAASRSLFGPRTIFVNAKRKIESKSLGGAVPDGFFFDFSDPDDPQFYMVEIEITKHSFYNHVFPQVTKFFAFFNNDRLQKSLVDKLYSVIDTDAALNSEFRKLAGKQEVYKAISDLIETSQNILLIADGVIPELDEIVETYTDTWGRLVKFLVVRKYALGQDAIYSVTPDFETIQYFEPLKTGPEDENEGVAPRHTEDFHLEGTAQIVKEIYAKIKELTLALDASLSFNPQKYYISIRAHKNIAFLKLRKKKVRLIVMMPESEIRSIVKALHVVALSQAVQDYCNGPCAAVEIPDLKHESEVRALIAALVKHNRIASQE